MDSLRRGNVHTVNLLAVCLAMQLCFFRRSKAIYFTFADIITELGVTGGSVWFELILSFLQVCVVTFVFYLPIKVVMVSKQWKYPLSVKRELPIYPFYILFFCVSVCLMTVISLDCVNGAFSWMFKINYYIPGGVLSLGLHFLVSVLFISVFWEVFFRGVVFPVLLPWGRTFAIFGAAFAGAVTAANMRQFVLFLVIGLLSGYFVSHTGTLWVGVFITVCSNVTVFLHDFILAEGIYASHAAFFRGVVAVIFGVGIYCCLKMDDQVTGSRVVPVGTNEKETRIKECIMAPCAVAYYIIVVASL